MMRLIFIVVTCCWGVHLSAQGPAYWETKIDAEVWADASQEKTFEFFVWLKDQANTQAAKQLPTKEAKGLYVFQTLKNKANETQGELLQFLQQAAVPFRPFYIVNGVWVKGDRALMIALAKRQEVGRIMPNPHIRNKHPEADNTSLRSPTQVEWGILMIRGNKVWDENIKGNGVIIGGQDTGYEWFHPAIKQQYRGDTTDHNYHWHDAIHGQLGSSPTNPCGYDSKVPCDDGSHGTHTMGTMVGDDGLGNQIGVAPEAEWIGCRNMDNGWGSPASYIECFEWFLAPTDTNDQNPDPSLSPHVIANSWACPPAEGCNSSNFHLMRQAVINLRNAGVFVEVSAGNSGPACHTINSPAAIFEESFTVGASDIIDRLVGFSSRGTVDVDSSYRLKPNVVAPGQGIRSCIPGNGYASYSGTSMAGPHVAGAVALLISADPQLAGNVDSLETILEITADTIIATDTCGNTLPTQIPNNMVGYGRINLAKALQLIRPDLFDNVWRIEENQVSVYPNPTTDKVYIRAAQPLGEVHIRVFNLMGQQLQAHRLLLNDFYPLSLNELPQGVYIVTIDNGSAILTTKVIKK